MLPKVTNKNNWKTHTGEAEGLRNLCNYEGLI